MYHHYFSAEAWDGHGVFGVPSYTMDEERESGATGTSGDGIAMDRTARETDGCAASSGPGTSITTGKTEKMMYWGREHLELIRMRL
jgi:hypothetical protein